MCGLLYAILLTSTEIVGYLPGGLKPTGYPHTLAHIRFIYFPAIMASANKVPTYILKCLGSYENVVANCLSHFKIIF